MFIAMNRFQVSRGREPDFEAPWRGRQSRIAGVPGFVAFHFQRGQESSEATLHASHTVWRNRAAFEAWTKSEAFRAAHGDAGAATGVHLGHPGFEGFEVLIDTHIVSNGAAA
jgi:heme-degrading monooxygenase HmoA